MVASKHVSPDHHHLHRLRRRHRYDSSSALYRVNFRTFWTLSIFSLIWRDQMVSEINIRANTTELHQIQMLCHRFLLFILSLSSYTFQNCVFLLRQMELRGYGQINRRIFFKSYVVTSKHGHTDGTLTTGTEKMQPTMTPWYVHLNGRRQSLLPSIVWT